MIPDLSRRLVSIPWYNHHSLSSLDWQQENPTKTNFITGSHYLAKNCQDLQLDSDDLLAFTKYNYVSTCLKGSRGGGNVQWIERKITLALNEIEFVVILLNAIFGHQ